MNNQEAREQAREIMQELAEATEQLETAQGLYQIELEKLKARHAEGIKRLAAIWEAQEARLKKFMKKNKGPLFDGRDQVKVPEGVMTYTKEDKVSIPRDALERIKVMNWTEAIRVAESVDRDMVETWPTERLVMIGAKKKLMEIFGYELKRGEASGSA